MTIVVLALVVVLVAIIAMQVVALTESDRAFARFEQESDARWIEIALERARARKEPECES